MVDDPHDAEWDAEWVEPATKRFLDHVGPAAAERSAPRLAPAVGGFAALLGGFAVAALGAEAIDGGAPPVLAALIALAYGGGGVALATLGLRSQHTAGVVAIAVAVPAAFAFLIFSGEFDRNDPAVVLALSAVAWGALHLVGPTRGHPVMLAGALAGAWTAVVVQVGIDGVSTALETPFGDPSSPVLAAPETSGAAVASLLFGAGYLAAGYGLDRAGLRGTATVFVGVALAALALGVLAATAGREEWLAGLVLVSAGSLVGFVGGHLGRRLSTWVGAGVAVAGAATFVESVVPDGDVAVGALAALATASAIIVAVPFLAVGMGEADDLDDA